MGLENKFGQDLARLLKAQGAIVAPYVASQWGISGFPDKIVISWLWIGFIELKSGNRQLTHKQRAVISQINQRRAWTAVEVREIAGHSEMCEVTYDGQEYLARRADLLSFLKEKRDEARTASEIAERHEDRAGREAQGDHPGL